ncbi:Copia-like polyprotein/retrotransposon [Ceratobasidium sp. AG-Ba]|nr:Copia-like polyprotein/retrotransposon [Ceratobasidium sp. AG-Ba]
MVATRAHLTLRDQLSAILTVSPNAVSTSQTSTGIVPPPSSLSILSVNTMSGNTASVALTESQSPPPGSPSTNAGPQATPSASQANPNPLSGLLAGLTPDQLSAIFGPIASLHNLVSSTQSQVATQPRDPSPPRSHKAATLIAMGSSLPKLRRDSYSEWSTSMRTAIQSCGLLQYIDTDLVCPAATEVLEHDRYIQEAGALRTIIMGTLDQGVSHHYLDDKISPREVWEAIKLRYRISDKAALRSIDERLFEVTKEQAIEWLYKSLPPSYDHFITLQQQTEEDNFDRICTRLETHYHSTASRGNSLVLAFPAASTTCGKSNLGWNIPHDLRGICLTGAKNPALDARSRDTCKACLDTGHRASQCLLQKYRVEIFGPQPQENWRQTSGQSNGRQNSQRSGRQANAAEVSGSDGTRITEVDSNLAAVDDEGFPECAAYSVSVEFDPCEVLALATNGHEAFLLDSGCQVHMTYLRSVFRGPLKRLVPPVII